MVMESGFPDSTNPLLVVGSSLAFEIVKPPLIKSGRDPLNISQKFSRRAWSRVHLANELMRVDC